VQILTPEEEAGHRNATLYGLGRGAVVGAGLSVPAHFIMRNRPFYRQVPITLKALGYVVLLVPCVSISAEKAGEAYDQSMWTGVGKREIDALATRESARWDQLTTTGKMKDWAGRNKYGIIAAR